MVEEKENKDKPEEEKQESVFTPASAKASAGEKATAGKGREIPASPAGGPEIRPGYVVRVHQKITELDAKGNPKERIQVFEGIVISRKGGNTPGATFTVRKIAMGGVGVEKIYPLHLPSIIKVEVVKKHKVRRAKLYYLRGKYKKKLKEIKE